MFPTKSKRPLNKCFFHSLTNFDRSDSLFLGKAVIKFSNFITDLKSARKKHKMVYDKNKQVIIRIGCNMLKNKYICSTPSIYESDM